MRWLRLRSDLLPALKHYIRAYSYFDRFSPLDRKRRSMSNKVLEVLAQAVSKEVRIPKSSSSSGFVTNTQSHTRRFANT